MKSKLVTILFCFIYLGFGPCCGMPGLCGENSKLLKDTNICVNYNNYDVNEDTIYEINELTKLHMNHYDKNSDLKQMNEFADENFSISFIPVDDLRCEHCAGVTVITTGMGMKVIEIEIGMSENREGDFLYTIGHELIHAYSFITNREMGHPVDYFRLNWDIKNYPYKPVEFGLEYDIFCHNHILFGYSDDDVYCPDGDHHFVETKEERK